MSAGKDEAAQIFFCLHRIFATLLFRTDAQKRLIAIS
jgi:hypothetical protein